MSLGLTRTFYLLLSKCQVHERSLAPGPRRRRLQRLDHAMIFFLIAGAATPAFLLTARGAFGWSACGRWSSLWLLHLNAGTRLSVCGRTKGLTGVGSHMRNALPVFKIAARMTSGMAPLIRCTVPATSRLVVSMPMYR